MAISEHDFFRQKYTTELKKLLAKKSKSKLLTKERYDELIEDLLEIAHDLDSNNNNNNIINDKENVKIFKNYGLIQIRGEQRLILPPQNQEPMKRYVHVDELYDILSDIHRKLKHCSRAQMMEHLKSSFANITMESVVLFYQMCDVCRAKAEKNRFPYFQKKKPDMDLSRKPLMRWQINIIDMTMEPDDDGNKYIFNFQDVDTKFCILKPLKNSEPKTIAEELSEIFGLFGAPHMISSFKKEFTSSIVECLKEIYPDLIILSADYLNYDQNQFRQVLETLCNKLNETNWSKVLKKLQFSLNTSVSENDQKSESSGKIMTPFERFFGREPQFGVSADLLLQLQTTNKSIHIEPKSFQNEKYLNENLSEASTSSRSLSFNSDGNDNDNDDEDADADDDEEDEDEEYALEGEFLEEILNEESDGDIDDEKENVQQDNDDTVEIETSAMKLVRSNKNNKKVDGGEAQKEQKKTMQKSVSFSLQKPKPKIRSSSPISSSKNQKVIKKH